MTEPNSGWPGEPGVPMNEERDGAHRLRHSESGLERDALWLCGGTWIDSYGEFTITHAALFYIYLGPCLTSDEATARAVKWAGIVGTLIAERDQLIGALQIAVERSGDMETPPAWVDGACSLLNRGFLKVDRAAVRQTIPQAQAAP
jgi:hypothetical protein